MFDGFAATDAACLLLLLLLLPLLPQLICQRLTHVLMDSVYRISIQYIYEARLKLEELALGFTPKSKFNIFVQ